MSRRALGVVPGEVLPDERMDEPVHEPVDDRLVRARVVRGLIVRGSMPGLSKVERVMARRGLGPQPCCLRRPALEPC
jgi:hypothetical protein